MAAGRPSNNRLQPMYNIDFLILNQKNTPIRTPVKFGFTLTTLDSIGYKIFIQVVFFYYIKN
jgi:hypothetical protein